MVSPAVSPCPVAPDRGVFTLPFALPELGEFAWDMCVRACFIELGRINTSCSYSATRPALVQIFGGVPFFSDADITTAGVSPLLWEGIK